jgi:hypothetical protein
VVARPDPYSFAPRRGGTRTLSHVAGGCKVPKLKLSTITEEMWIA